jgi:hypothetical protein
LAKGDLGGFHSRKTKQPIASPPLQRGIRGILKTRGIRATFCEHTNKGKNIYLGNGRNLAGGWRGSGNPPWPPFGKGGNVKQRLMAAFLKKRRRNNGIEVSLLEKVGT